MRIRFFLLSLLCLFCTLATSHANSAPVTSATPVAPVVGQPVPDFIAQAADGTTVRLSDLKGRIVVLEWTNNECPFVRKHYGSGNMQTLQKAATAHDVVWLSVISSAPGKQGNVDAARAQALTAERRAAPTHVLLDPAGELGHSYDARTTPHMFVIDKTGTLAYAGGIDDKPSVDPADVAGAKNYVSAALTDLYANRTVDNPRSAPYGCSIKY